MRLNLLCNEKDQSEEANEEVSDQKWRSSEDDHRGLSEEVSHAKAEATSQPSSQQDGEP